jgi:signal transduction histidine kinase
VTNFLDFARPKEPQIVLGDLNAVLEKSLSLAEHHRSGAVISVETDLSPDLPPVPIDPEQCEQVFLNLVLNALEAMPEGGTLRVSSMVSDGEAILEFSDTGPGIDPGHLSAIFDPFFTTKPSGTGLGLSVVHQIVDSHGGRIEVVSEVGQGSEFRVHFPLSPSADATADVALDRTRAG